MRLRTKWRKKLLVSIVGRPQLEYAATVWDPYTQDDTQKIEMVQRRAPRWVLDFSPFASISDMIGRLSWRTLEQRRAGAELILFYKIIYASVAVPLPAFIIPLAVSHDPLIHRLTDSSMAGLIIINTNLLPTYSHPME